MLVQDRSDLARLAATRAHFSYPSSAEEDSYRALDKSGASVVAESWEMAVHMLQCSALLSS